MKMVTRIGLVVALACIAVPATLMGNTWYFIRQNPALDTASADGDTAIWWSDIMQIEGEEDGDSTPTAPDGFVAITSAGLDSLDSLFSLTLASGNYAVDSHVSPGRMWKSSLQWGTMWFQGKLWKIMECKSGTYRTGFWPGYVAVTDSFRYYNKYVHNPWVSWPLGKSMIVWNRIMYPYHNTYWWWRLWGTHSWGSDWQYSYIQTWY